jgi:hypothetical protein
MIIPKRASNARCWKKMLNRGKPPFQKGPTIEGKYPQQQHLCPGSNRSQLRDHQLCVMSKFALKDVFVQLYFFSKQGGSWVK